MDTNEPDRVRSQLAQVAAQIASYRERQRKLTETLHELENDKAALERTLRLIGEEVPEITVTTSRSERGGMRVIDAIIEVVAPDEMLTVREIVSRLAGRTDIKLSSATPGATVSTALSRGKTHFKLIRKGVYQRIGGEESAPTPKPNGHGIGAITEQEQL